MSICCSNPTCRKLLTAQEIRASKEFFVSYHYCEKCLDEEMGEVINDTGEV